MEALLEVIHCRHLGRSVRAVELATLESVSWFNHPRPLERSAVYRRPELRQPITGT
jgi:hypothetical protein